MERDYLEQDRNLKELQKYLEEKKQSQKRFIALDKELKYITTFIATTLGRTKVSGSRCHFVVQMFILY